jgi:hypothetical protein
MVGLRVCPCFRLSGYEEFMEPVANRPWDAWHVMNDGRRLSLNYVSDGFYDYLKHLLHSPMCREYAGLSYGIVLVWFRRLKESRKSIKL